jgi:fatty-acyl-CoA synthase
MSAERVPLSPLSFLDRAAAVYPDRTAVVAGDGSVLGYADLHSHASTMAGRLNASGVGTGDRVAILAPNDVPLLAAHYGVPASGAALVALNTRLAAEEYHYILNHAGVALLIVDAELADRLGPNLRTAVPGLKQVLQIDGDGSYADWLSQGQTDGQLRLSSSEDTPITVNYTSGTTGRPKGVVYTHRGAYLAALGVALQMHLTPGSVYLWTLPMFHCNGWCFTWAVTAASATHVCQRRFDADDAIDLIERHRVSHFCGAPVVLNSIVNAPRAGTVTFDHPVTTAVGGAPPSPTVIARAAAMNLDVVHLYGLTETYGPSLVCEPQPSWRALDPTDLAVLTARQGVRTVHVEGVRVVDESMTDVPADATTIGEIVVRSNTVMAGYLHDEQATREAFRGGWFHTGDLAVRHPDGYLEIRDRAKDIIISGGENISSIEVENVLASHPAVLEAAVVATTDDRWGEVPVAFVAVRPGECVDATELIAWVRGRLAHYKAPRAVHFGELPKTSTGKIRKNELRDRIRSTAKEQACP